MRLLPEEFRTTRPKRDDEDQLQKAVWAQFLWRRQKGVIGWHTPNGGKRSKASGGKLHAMGVVPGVFDLIFLLPGPRTCLLELKVSGGSVSKEQTEFARGLDELGIEWAIAWSLDQALAILEAWDCIKPEAE